VSSYFILFYFFCFCFAVFSPKLQ